MDKIEIDTYIVDSFTDQPFKGNPAGVCILKDRLSVDKMQSIAIELGLSETAFVIRSEKENKYSIRYFSPKMEIPLCGHATLAASKIIFEKDTDITRIHFVNNEGLDLRVNKIGQVIVMEFPVYKTISGAAPSELLIALGIEKVINTVYNEETRILVIEIEDCDILTSLTPNFERLVNSHQSINGVLVTALSNKTEYDFESRYFWPWSGTNEDPVTGATHTFLAKYWSDRLNKNKMQSFQCSPRTGFMEVELIDDHRLRIKSQAQIVLEGKLRI